MSETNEMRQAMIDLSTAGVRVFRNNIAQGVVGKVTYVRGQDPVTVTLRPGDAYVRGARVLHAGLEKGSADLIGLTPVEVSPAMVGRTVPIFTSLEMKWGKGKQEADQKTWERFMLRHGAIHGVAWSAADAVAIVDEYRRGAK